MPDPYVQGPLIMQTPEAAALAEVLVKGAERLWDAACEEETPAMWETGREVASWVLSVCHRAEGETVKRRQRRAAGSSAPGGAETPSGGLAAPASPVYLPGMTPLAADPG